MKHAIVVGHPDPASFTLSMARTYAKTIADIGHTAVLRDLYRMGFNPCLSAAELPGHAPVLPQDIATERDILRDADVIAFIYPLWFNSPPAIVKGYMERVFGLGFGYETLRNGSQGPLLTSKQMIHLTSSSSRNAWMNEQGAFHSLRNLFDDYFGRVCGMQVRPHIHSPSIEGDTEERWILEALKSAETRLRKYFDPDEWQRV